MNGDSPSVQPQRGGDLEHLLAHPAQAPALSGLPLQEAAQAMQDLVGVETEQQAHLVARHHVLNGGGAAIRRREVHVECRLHLAHVRFGAAALAVERQDLLRRPVELAEVDDQEEGMQQQIIGVLLHHQHHATRCRPGTRLVRQVVAPLARLLGLAGRVAASGAVLPASVVRCDCATGPGIRSPDPPAPPACRCR